MYIRSALEKIRLNRRIKMAKPEVKELVLELKSLVDWKNFGQHLPGIKQFELAIIERQNKDDIVAQKQSLFYKWRSKCPNATRKDIQYALHNADNKELAEKVCKNHNLPQIEEDKKPKATNTPTQNVVTNNEATGQGQTQPTPTTRNTQSEATESANTGQGQTQPTTGHTQREATESANTGQGQTQPTTGNTQREATDGTSTTSSKQ